AGPLGLALLGPLPARFRRAAACSWHHRLRSWHGRGEAPGRARETGAPLKELRRAGRVPGRRAGRVHLARTAARLLAGRELARYPTRRRRRGVGHPCITVRRGHRGQGVAVAMIRAAVDYAGRRGAPAVEAYPRADGKRVHDDFAFFGTRATWLGC